MKKVLMLIIFVTLIIQVYAVDELWQKAQQLAENSWRLVPGKTTMRMKFSIGFRSNSFGEFEFEVVYTTSLNENNEIVAEVISYQKLFNLPDENDINQYDFNFDENDPEYKEMMKQVERETGNNAVSSDMALASHEEALRKAIAEAERIPSRKGLFFETNKRNLSVKKMKDTKIIDNRLCQAYNVRYTPDGKRSDRQEGTIWLDAETGTPVLSEIKPTKTPMLIKSMDSKTHYKYLNDEKKYYRTFNEVHTAGGLLGFRIIVEMSEVYDEYWEYSSFT